MRQLPFFLVMVCFSFCCRFAVAAPQHAAHSSAVSSPNVADASLPYADPKLGREGIQWGKATINELRIYDFYQRQADYYMELDAAGSAVPKVLPAFPGLDAGLHGHWGKYNKNNHQDDRINQMDMGSVVVSRLKLEQSRIHKAVNLQLGDNADIAATFDPWTFCYRAIWKNGFVSFDPFRWGTSRGVTVDSETEPWFQHDGRMPGFDRRNDKRIVAARYHGFYRHGKRVIFQYQLNGVTLLDHPWTAGDGDAAVFSRTIRLDGRANKEWHLPIAQLPIDSADGLGLMMEVVEPGRVSQEQSFTIDTDHVGRVRVVGEDASVKLAVDDHGRASLRIPAGKVNQQVTIYLWRGKDGDDEQAIAAMDADSPPKDLTALTRGGNAQWPQRLVMPGKLAADDGSEPYVIDSLPVPFENPFHSVMMLSGIDFLSNGDAVVSTLMGDVWLVSGIDDELAEVTWKRFAAGLYQPFGVKVVDDKIFVLAKEQLYVLQDLNNDGEADFYQNYDNSWVETHGHTHVFGLDCDRDMNFYFPAYDVYYKLPPDGSGVELIAKGFRNCMGSSVREDGLVLASSQEGTWTPASQIIEVRRGEHYGHKRTDEPIALPMCFIPRGVDNSTGGMMFISSERWGPLGKSIIGLSYGYGSHYLILRDESMPRAQGAVVPLAGEFVSGVVRGRINPKDGQFYVVGTDGWGNYALRDGCLDRVRYTGKPVHQPIGFHVHRNGVRIDFPVALDAQAVKQVSNYFCQQWNYLYSKQYGSPEFSVRRPNMLGHDRLRVRTAQLLNDGKSIFVELPGLQPSCQMQIRMHLTSAEGTAFKTDLFASPLMLGKQFEFSGAAAEVSKPDRYVLRMKDNKPLPVKYSNPNLKVTKTFKVGTVPGLRYDKTTLFAKPGEAIAIELTNKDDMPHNLVIVQPGAYEKVGLLSFNMLNDPEAFDRHYVPDVPEIVSHTRVVFQGESHTIKFLAPEKPDRYPFMCTFPGHWQTMTGQLIVGDVAPDPDSTDEVIQFAEILAKEDAASLAADSRQHGDPIAGAKLFYRSKMSCALCHDPKAVGGETQLGPDLAATRDGVTDTFLVNSVLNPSKVIREGYASVMLMTIDGDMRSGYRVEETPQTLVVRDASGKIRTYLKDDLEHIMPSKVSTMPQGLVNQLESRQQFLDLIRFLMTANEGGKRQLDKLKSDAGIGPVAAGAE